MKDNDNNEMKTFAELGVEPKLLQAIQEMGFELPMPIQEMVIPHLLNKEGDVVGLAQTGTGKTAAFGLPVLQRIDVDREVPQALIIAPTRELCLQIAGDLADFAKYVEGLRILPVYGGSSIESQIKALRRGVQVIVATPGRLIDLINRKVVDLHDVHTVILDEADEMLNMGFLDDIKEILTHVPVERKMLMFSATMPDKIQRLAKSILNDPVRVEIAVSKPAENIRQEVVYLYETRKLDAVKEIFAGYEEPERSIIFASSKLKVKELAHTLKRMKLNVAAMHSDLEQAQREEVMLNFKINKVKILVATDIVARGIDIEDIGLVLNYDVPHDPEDYIHRIGRTARAAATGSAVTFGSEEEQGTISYWSVLFKATSFSDLVSRIDFINEIVRYNQQVIKNLRDTRQQLADDKAALEEQNESLTASKKELEGEISESMRLLAEYIKTEEGKQAEYDAIKAE